MFNFIFLLFLFVFFWDIQNILKVVCKWNTNTIENVILELLHLVINLISCNISPFRNFRFWSQATQKEQMLPLIFSCCLLFTMSRKISFLLLFRKFPHYICYGCNLDLFYIKSFNK